MFRRRARLLTLILASLALIAVCVLTPAAIRAHSSYAAPAPTAIPDRMRSLTEQARTQGHVRVIVSLRVPATQAPHALTANALASAQPSIRQARDTLIAGLQGTTVSVNAGKDWVFPAVALTVDARALARLQTSPLVATIVQDGQSRPLDTGSDALIGAPAAWSAGYTGQGQTVAVLDTGVQSDHPFLTNRVVAEACFSTTNAITATVSLCPNGMANQIGSGAAAPCALTICGHGTHVAGDAAGKGIFSGGPGYNGVAPDAGIIAVQVFSGLTNGGTPGGVYDVTAFDSDIISGLNWVYTQRATYHIAAVNMSLGNSSLASSTACDATNSAMKTAIDTLRAADISTVIAAGNDGFSYAIAYPACISSAISVGAVDNTDAVAYFSDRDPLLTFWAPGVNVLSSEPPSSYGSKNGTSMAAPMVAGALAVLRSKNPGASEDTLICVLQNTGKPIVDTASGTTKPRIQLDAAVSALPAPGDPQACTPPPTPTATATTTPTPAPTGTATATSTSTPVSPTATGTSTKTNTPVSPTATSTSTGTSTPVPPTATPTNTSTPVPPTATSTATSTATHTPTAPASTATATATATSTPLPPTSTRTPTSTPTGTSTATATETPALPTATATATPSNTGTTTATPTGTAMPAISTSTPTATATSSETPVPTDGGPGGPGTGTATPELGSGGLFALGLLPLALALGAVRRCARRRQHGPE